MIIHTKKFVRYDGNGTNRRVVTYRVSDSPEFYCHTGLHAWYDEEDAERCCHDGLTQGLIRGMPVLIKASVAEEKQRRMEEGLLSRLFGKRVSSLTPLAVDFCPFCGGSGRDPNYLMPVSCTACDGTGKSH